jgi:hypothetical protein
MARKIGNYNRKRKRIKSKTNRKMNNKIELGNWEQYIKIRFNLATAIPSDKFSPK